MPPERRVSATRDWLPEPLMLKPEGEIMIRFNLIGS